jgi:hypothetical protein
VCWWLPAKMHHFRQLQMCCLPADLGVRAASELLSVCCTRSCRALKSDAGECGKSFCAYSSDGHKTAEPILQLHHPPPFLPPASASFFFRAASSLSFSTASCLLISSMTSVLLCSTLMSSSSFFRLLSCRPSNHSLRAASSAAGVALATMQLFMASRWLRHTQVADTVRPFAHAANSVTS